MTEAAASPSVTEPRECQTRIVVRNDHGRVVIHSHDDEEPESIEVPSWAVRAIFAEAGKDPEDEAAKFMAAVARMEARQ